MTAIDTDVAAVQRMFDVNLFGPMRMVHHFHGMLIKTEGVIVNIGSIGGVIPYLYGCTQILSKSTYHLMGRVQCLAANKTTSILQCQQGRTCALVQYPACRDVPIQVIPNDSSFYHSIFLANTYLTSQCKGCHGMSNMMPQPSA